MSTHLPGFRSYARVSVIFQVFLHHFVFAKLAISSIRVKAKDMQSKVTTVNIAW